MSKTKFIKVEERLPTEQGMYMVIFKNNKVGKFNFGNEEAFRESWIEHVTFWLEEVPDREEEMREMLEECRLQLEYLNGRFPTGTTSNILSRLQKLLNK